MQSFDQFKEEIDRVKLESRHKVHKGYYITNYIYVYDPVSLEITVYDDDLLHSCFLALFSTRFIKNMFNNTLDKKLQFLELDLLMVLNFHQ